jgi:hypothetical protein
MIFCKQQLDIYAEICTYKVDIEFFLLLQYQHRSKRDLETFEAIE